MKLYRQQSRYVMLSVARSILERVSGRKYEITAVTMGVMKHNLDFKSSGKIIKLPKQTSRSCLGILNSSSSR